MRQPIRMFSIATCMRFERPQRGRTRQFEQLNVDVLGGPEQPADFEILTSILLMMRKLGVPNDLFEIRVNHRKAVEYVLNSKLGITTKGTQDLIRTLDAYAKMDASTFETKLRDHGLSNPQVSGLVKFMDGDTEYLREIESSCPHFAYLVDLVDAVRSAVGENAGSIRIAPEVMRGFDYYTGVVFEVFDVSPENRRALFGGGRYDDLVGALSKFAVSGVGYGVSEVSILNFLSTHDLLPRITKNVEVFAFAASTDFLCDLQSLCCRLRTEGVQVELHPSALNIGKGLKLASSAGARVALFLGEEEYARKEGAMKNLRTQTQLTFAFENVAAIYHESIKAE